MPSALSPTLSPRGEGDGDGDGASSFGVKEWACMSPSLTADELLCVLTALPPHQRDAELERLLGISEPVDRRPPGPDLVGYHPSGLVPVLTAILEARVGADDLFVDLGAGLGKVTTLVRLLTGARVRGIELQPELLARAARLEGVELLHADAREAPLDDGTVFFLYNPFEGAALRVTLERLHRVAQHHAIVLCALGLTVNPVPWLEPRPLEHFWLTVFDSVVPGIAPRRQTAARLDPRVRQLADER